MLEKYLECYIVLIIIHIHRVLIVKWNLRNIAK